MQKRLINLLKNVKHSRGKSFWSETGEDTLLKQIFTSSIGKYIDIGAGHPIIGSNSYLFYKFGWSGICIDPQIELKLAYKYLRPRDLFIPTVVTNSNSAILYEFENSLLSTTNFAVASYHKANGHTFATRKYKPINLRDYLPKLISSEDPFFISIDVEGSEIDVLKHIDFKRQRPRAIMIEEWSYPWAGASKINPYLRKFNYKLIAYTGLTAMYIPKEVDTKSSQLRFNLSKIV